MMLDQTGCPKGGGVHVWCYPNDWGKVKCGWYQHNNGKCSNKCPGGYTEVGSNAMYCNNGYDGNYQAACCEFEKRSMELYTNLEWSKYPNCNSGLCPYVNQNKDQVLTRSRTGSGAAICKAQWDTTGRAPRIAGYESRPLCYGYKHKKGTWKECIGRQSFGGGSSGQSDYFCDSGCPDNAIRLAMDTHTCNCRGHGGANSLCCRPSLFVEHSAENPEIAEFREALGQYLKQPKCPVTGPSVLLPRAAMTLWISQVSSSGGRISDYLGAWRRQ